MDVLVFLKIWDIFCYYLIEKVFYAFNFISSSLYIPIIEHILKILKVHFFIFVSMGELVTEYR